MRAIILAAGIGSRLRPYTDSTPKCLLDFGGKSLLERHIDNYHSRGITDITVVTGYRGEDIQRAFPNLDYFHNPRYDSTNMIESLFCARQRLDGDLVIAYADSIIEGRVLDALLQSRADVGVAADTAWRDYWQIRYGNHTEDLKTLKFSQDALRIIEMGKPTKNPNDMDGKFFGHIRLTAQGVQEMLTTYDQATSTYANSPLPSGRQLQQMFMDDLIQLMIDRGITVSPIKVKNGWLEFDTVSDYENMLTLLLKSQLGHIFSG